MNVLLVPLALVTGIWLFAAYRDWQDGQHDVFVRDVLIVFLLVVMTFLLTGRE